jgi:hypothetical protein
MEWDLRTIDLAPNRCLIAQYFHHSGIVVHTLLIPVVFISFVIIPRVFFIIAARWLKVLASTLYPAMHFHIRSLEAVAEMNL